MPKSKTRAKIASKCPRTQRFRLTVEAQPMLVTYKPDHSESPFAQGNFTFTSPHRPARRIPVSETGYWSHFAPMWEIEEAEGPEAYARSLALAVINGRARHKPTDREPTVQSARSVTGSTGGLFRGRPMRFVYIYICLLSVTSKCMQTCLHTCIPDQF
jgi:hypothetical protein